MSGPAVADLTLELIREAAGRIAGHVHRTPTIRSQTLSDRFGCDVHLKLECLQKTGSFKPRGAFNKILSLTPAQRAAGLVAVSGGNHAQGVAYAAKATGASAVIVMPQSTPLNYVNATRGYGASVVLVADIKAAFAEVERLRQTGLTLVHPFDDLLVAAGQGTVGLEIAADVPDLTRVYASIGGGAFVAGIAAAVKSIKPAARVIGVQTEGADAMSRSVKENRLVELPAITSIARTLGAPKVSDFTLAAVKKWLEKVTVVGDAEAFAALEFLLERTKQLVEPAASCCLAALERDRAELGTKDRVVIVLCGGNVSLADLCTYRTRFQ